MVSTSGVMTLHKQLYGICLGLAHEYVLWYFILLSDFIYLYIIKKGLF
jgi:hypothetical protein